MKLYKVRQLVTAIDSGKTKNIDPVRLEWAKKNLKKLKAALAGKGKSPQGAPGRASLTLVKASKAKTAPKKKTTRAAKKPAKVTSIASRRKPVVPAPADNKVAATG